MGAPPYQAALVDASGRVTPGPWRAFLDALAAGLGGGGAGASSAAGFALASLGLDADAVGASIAEVYSMLPPAAPAPSFTAGSVIFAGASGGLAQDNATFFFDDTNNVLRVPVLVGGTGVDDDLKLRATTGVGTTNSRIFLEVGTNGAIQAVEVKPDAGGNFGQMGIGTPGNLAVTCPLTVFGTGADLGYLILARAANGAPNGLIQMQTGANAAAQAGFSFNQRQNSVEWIMAVVGNDGDAMRWQAITGGGAVTTTVLYVTLNGNIVHDSARNEPASGTKILVIGDGTAPGNLAANTAAFYADDVGGTVEMFVKNEANEVSQLSGHMQIASGKLLRLGGATATEVALKRASTVLEVKLADDSAYAALRAFALRITDGAFLVRAEAALTDGAGAALGTLTTAPTAGDPTKWIPIDDNGTTRYVPAW